MSQQATEKEITINGETVKVADLLTMLQMSRQTVQMHAALLSDLKGAADNLAVHQAASFFSANASLVIFGELLSSLEIGDGVAVKLLLEIGAVINRAHKAFWNDFQTADEGQTPVLPADLASRRDGLLQRLADARGGYAELGKRVAALAIEHPAKTAASVVTAALAKVESGAAESVEAAFGRLQMSISDEQLQQIIQQAMGDLLFVGKSEEEARAIIVEKLGTTPEAQKQALVQSQVDGFGLDRQGVRDGALLSAEQEIASLEQGVALVNGLLG